MSRHNKISANVNSLGAMESDGHLQAPVLPSTQAWILRGLSGPRGAGPQTFISHSAPGARVCVAMMRCQPLTALLAGP